MYCMCDLFVSEHGRLPLLMLLPGQEGPEIRRSRWPREPSSRIEELQPGEQAVRSMFLLPVRAILVATNIFRLFPIFSEQRAFGMVIPAFLYPADDESLGPTSVGGGGPISSSQETDAMTESLLIGSFSTSQS